MNDVLGVAGFVLPGDRVDVLLTRDEFVDVLLQGLKVLAIDQIADELKDNPSVVRTVTFEVNTEEAQKLVLGEMLGHCHSRCVMWAPQRLNR
ncbi:Flp pilus assembly protein CpaB [Sulfitobacter sediminilitoris]|uniref:Flp pilus assembly protein CpaB n=1 Tax=Sulfitobacter sediminilitoris TaxID=2698830 RepID=UPI0036213A85